MDENSNFRKENEGELSAFSTEHLAVGYDKMPLIKDVNLQVRPGEILTLIGPNGSGKSTILKTITRQLKQIGGTVYLGKETMRGMGDNEVSRRLSMVMTERVRTELMSGREVVASGRYPYTGRLGILSPEDWEKVDEAIALVHAKEVQEQDFMKISDGQRQRLMLARAIAQDTKILVLDEPTSYLDMGFKLDILANIRLLARERNLAIVMSLHELDLAQKISDTIACVKGIGSIASAHRKKSLRETMCRSCMAWQRKILIHSPDRCFFRKKCTGAESVCHWWRRCGDSGISLPAKTEYSVCGRHPSGK